ncbi:hypothetical protein [Benzoatithermus flavus]|uniref:Uncharacterized protein n=1 Tax=Benzoatithermus flavus TaxID=3108223 RepID=A0ABU8XNB7_9PROT
MISLHAIRSGHSCLLVALLWFHAALAALVGWTQHAETTLLGTIIDVAIALVATLQQRRTSPWLHLTLSVGAMAGIAVLLAELAVLALLIGLCDWRAIVTAATVVAGHHLVLGLTAPHYVFHGGSHLGRIVLHAVILAVEAGAAIFLCRKLVALVGSIEQ